MLASKTWFPVVFVLAVNTNSVFGGQINVLNTQGTSTLRPLQNNVTSECSSKLNGLRFETTEVADQALDAFGKPEAGLLVNHRQWLGHYSECSHLEDFKYCSLTVNVTSVTALPRNNQTYLITWGICVPRQCSHEDLSNEVSTLLDLSSKRLLGFYVNDIYKDAWCLEDPVWPYGLGFYITVTFFVMVGTFMISGSIVDIIERSFVTDVQESDKSKEIIPLLEDHNVVQVDEYLGSSNVGCKWFFRKLASNAKLFLLDFAVNRNLKTLLHVSKSGDRNISCLHGIRVISMFWVILGHVYVMPLSRNMFNKFEFAEWKDNFLFQTLILNFFFAVDSFFFLSGLLVCFTTLHKLETTQATYPWHWFYLHRYIRLSPLMLVTIMIEVFLKPHFLRGPYALTYIGYNSCSSYWWTNLIYINNFYPWNFSKGCMVWTWYLANDMQFFIISPLIILAFKRVWWLGFGIIATLLTISFAVTGTIVAVFRFKSPAWELWFNSSDYASIIYRMPYTRIPPYLVGMILGYILFKQNGKRVVIPRRFILAGWLIASAVAAAILCGTITFSSSTDNTNERTKTTLWSRHTFIADHHASAVGSIMFEMFSRFAWGLFLSWVVIVCQFGGSGWVNDILSCSFWEPLSRMNYNAYLIHLLVLSVLYGNFAQSFYASHILMTYYFCGIVLITYISAMFLTLAVEIPVSKIERRLISRSV